MSPTQSGRAGQGFQETKRKWKEVGFHVCFLLQTEFCYQRVGLNDSFLIKRSWGMKELIPFNQKTAAGNHSFFIPQE
jgi:hypothetical protein